MAGARVTFDYYHGVSYVGKTDRGQRCFKIRGGYLLVPAGVTFCNHSSYEFLMAIYRPHNTDVLTKMKSLASTKSTEVYTRYLELLDILKDNKVKLRMTHTHNQKTRGAKHTVNGIVLGIKVPQGVYVTRSTHGCAVWVVRCLQVTEGWTYVGQAGSKAALQTLITKAEEKYLKAYKAFDRRNRVSYDDARVLHKTKPKLKAV